MLKQFQDAIASGDIQGIITSTLGQIILVAIALILLIAVVALGSRSQSMKTKELVYSAIAIAIAVALSYVKLVTLPQGGSITLFSMLFIAVIGYWFGTVQGIICGMTYGLLQLALGGWVMHPIQLLLDYPLAFGMLGFAGLMRNTPNGLMKGLILGAFGRFLCHFIAGVVFFQSYAIDLGFDPVPYSIGYNLAYIAGEIFLTLIILMVPQVTDVFKQLKKMALS